MVSEEGLKFALFVTRKDPIIVEAEKYFSKILSGKIPVNQKLNTITRWIVRHPKGFWIWNTAFSQRMESIWEAEQQTGIPWDILKTDGYDCVEFRAEVIK